MNNQATSVPYSLDVLPAHDPSLLQAIEFGTNTAPAAGDFFDWSAGNLSNYSAAIDARLAMLRIRLYGGAPGIAEPRGQSFVLPPFSAWPLLPALGPGARGAVLYAHALYRGFGSSSAAPDSSAGIIIGNPDALLGVVPLAQQTGVRLGVNVPVPFPGVFPAPDLYPAATYTADSLLAGALRPPPFGPVLGPNGGGSRYWRVQLWYRPGAPDQVEGLVMGSRDGLSWAACGGHMVGEGVLPLGSSLRVGAFVTGKYLDCALDWVRLYGSPTVFTGDDDTETGGRLFVR